MRKLHNLFTVLLLLGASTVYGSEDHIIEGLTGTNIAASAVIDVEDQWYDYMKDNPSTWGNRFHLGDKKVRVKLWWDNALRNHYGSSWSVTVNYDLILWDGQSTEDIDTLTGRTLTIDFDPLANYTDIDLEDYTGYLRGQVSINSVTVTGGITLTDDIHLDAEVITTRYFDLNTTETPNVIPVSYDATTNKLLIAWDYVEGAESYDVEWLFFDTGGDGFSGSNSYDFSNATRININDNHYYISMGYPEGIFVFRARAVGYSILHGREEGKWSLAKTGNTNSVASFTTNGTSYTPKYNFAGLLETMSWQYQVTYSEQGKYKEAMTYYDGSLRNRQSITSINSDSTAIVGQTIYDFVGRPAVTVAPAPRTYAGVKFYSDNSKVNSSDQYDWTDFDTDAKYASPDAMSTSESQGAAHYYSSSNSTPEGINGDYIPDANGYPYSRAKYMNDGTGRLISQSGLGDSLTVGSGHETMYFYGTPTGQEELDRLFGNEVGWVGQYKKNMVIDPNGQASISYIDQNGRTIASALAGDSPDNLVDIDTKPTSATTITADLTTFNQLNTSDEWVATNTFLVPVTTQYTFTYSLDDSNYVNCGVDGDCRYDLFIHLYADTGEVDINGASSGRAITYTSVTSVADTTFSKTLGVGSYKIQKILRLNSAHYDSTYQEYLDSQNCITPPVPTSNSDCDLSCSEICESQYIIVAENGDTLYLYENGNIAAIIDSNDVIIQGTQVLVDSVLDLIDTCLANGCPAMDKMNSQLDQCQIRLNMLGEDMSPNGQYFDNLPYLDSTNYDINAWLRANISGADSTNIRTKINAATTTHTTSSWTWDQLRTHWHTFEDEWSDGMYATIQEYMATHHPEYCAWENYCDSRELSCGEGHSIDGIYEYEATMFSNDYPTTPTSEAMWNPTDKTKVTSHSNSATYQPFDDNHGSADHDPLPYCKSGFKTELDSLLEVFLTDGTSKYSLWYVTLDPYGIAPDNGGNTSGSTKVDSIFTYLHGDATNGITGLIGSGTGQISEYEFFRSGYNFLRQYVWYNSSCSRIQADYAGLSSDGFRVHYPVMDAFEQFGGSNLNTYASNAVNDSCEFICAQYADSWILELGSCINSDSAEVIKQLLIDVCALGCSDTTPVGSMDGDDSTTCVTHGPWCFYDFEDIISHYGTNCTTTLQHPPTVYDTSMCACTNVTQFVNGYLLDLGYTIPDDADAPIQSTYLADTLSAAEETGLVDELEEYLFADETGDFSFSEIQGWYIDCINDSTSITDTLPTAMQCDSALVPTWDISDFADSCATQMDSLATYNDQLAFEQSLFTAALAYMEQYTTVCFTDMTNRETFTVQYDLDEYHYTLYYFDQADNLIKTVPPSGVDILPLSHASDPDVEDSKDYRNGTDTAFIHPDHGMVTNYKYNSLQQLIEQHTPDGGQTSFWYDPLGRVVISQNAKQAADNVYSYTIYDDLDESSSVAKDGLGRITEVGQIGENTTTGAMTDEISRDEGQLADWLQDSNAGKKTQVTRTYYDTAFSATIENELGNGYDELFSRNRISTITYEAWNDDVDTTYDFATHYSYDVNGNVKTLIQEISELSHIDQHFKRLDYVYDLVSGNVNELHYQTGEYDEFHYRYEYDGDNRLTKAYTSNDNSIWQLESKNFYYKHGPLARKEIGDRQVQACDYAYSINGWLKAVNSSMGHQDRDMGADGKNTTGINAYQGRDIHGFSLHYFDNDYEAIGSGANANMLASWTNSTFDNDSPGLYNGNISKMITGIRDNSEDMLDVLGNAYRYDQLNRIKHYRAYQNGSTLYSTNSLSTAVKTSQEYHTNYTFDGNGNITYLERHGDSGTGTSMDELSYQYYKTDGTTYDPDTYTGTDITNKLAYVDDNISSSYSEDIDDQGADNFGYDEIGQMYRDSSENITMISWRVDNKVDRILRNHDGANDMQFKYGPMGNRVVKISKPRSAGVVRAQEHWDYTYYVRDASGNPIAVYKRGFERDGANYKDSITVAELNVYSDKRLGYLDRNLTKSTTFSSGPIKDLSLNIEGRSITEKVFDTTQFSYGTLPNYASGALDTVNTVTLAAYDRELGNKKYELSNHLGNVLQVITDIRLSDDTDTDDTTDYYYPDVIAHNDYYPYGMQITDRHGSMDGYRYSFQGQEKDDEIKGEGNSINYSFRRYDPRLGRFLSIDPESANFAFQSPYAYALNNPIRFIDRQGRDPGDPVVDSYFAGKGNVMIIIMDQTSQEFNMEKARAEAMGWDIVAANDMNAAGKLVNEYYGNSEHRKVGINSLYVRTHGNQQALLPHAIRTNGSDDVGVASIFPSSIGRVLNSGIENLDPTQYRDAAMNGLVQAFEHLNPGSVVLFSGCNCGMDNSLGEKFLKLVEGSGGKAKFVFMNMDQTNSVSDGDDNPDDDYMEVLNLNIDKNLTTKTDFKFGWRMSTRSLSKDQKIRSYDLNRVDSYVPKIEPEGGFSWSIIDKEPLIFRPNIQHESQVGVGNRNGNNNQTNQQ